VQIILIKSNSKKETKQSFKLGSQSRVLSTNLASALLFRHYYGTEHALSVSEVEFFPLNPKSTAWVLILLLSLKRFQSVRLVSHLALLDITMELSSPPWTSQSQSGIYHGEDNSMVHIPLGALCSSHADRIHKHNMFYE
jgi:hypothetical protein